MKLVRQFVMNAGVWLRTVDGTASYRCCRERVAETLQPRLTWPSLCLGAVAVDSTGRASVTSTRLER